MQNTLSGVQEILVLNGGGSHRTWRIQLPIHYHPPSCHMPTSGIQPAIECRDEAMTSESYPSANKQGFYPHTEEGYWSLMQGQSKEAV